ncbi:MAG TPA: Asp-tRNA(Asn)/Glu-tRNA(Gln) amidotransferase subunit GatC [Planctomycetota bacterium]|nr:Asp-tRNA(Asn)/Glu-tRNA(Gln) amidotransferase subunit GatC [Planctomycetota bacterium]
MAIERAKVDEIAKLARLKLSEELSVKMTSQLGSILDYIDQLKEVKTDGVEPFICAPSSGEAANLHFRPDGVLASLPHDKVLQNASQRDETYFLVPPPLKGEAEE